MFLLDLLSVVAFSRIFDFFENREVMDLWSTITAWKNHELECVLSRWFHRKKRFENRTINTRLVTQKLHLYCTTID